MHHTVNSGINVLIIVDNIGKGGILLAKRIPDDLLAEICSENDIIDYVSQHTQLKKAGRDYMGLCPFHTEKTPSFHVNREKQLFHCFGCGASGNLVQFIMRTENIGYIDAVEILADRAGIALPEDTGYDDKNSEKKKQIYEMNKLAARFFHECLKDPNLGTAGREYLQQRRISIKIIKTYGLGFAPYSNTRRILVDHLISKGYTEAQMIEASLAIERDGNVIDKFRNRIMFPIIDIRGRVIGFGGRVMHNQKDINGYNIPKYLNSSETPVFDKGRNLFSLNLAKNAKSTELILCEGYMDVISTYQAGIPNIVATLGTAITENQAKILMRYTNEVIICYDSDEAGQKAAVRACGIMNTVGGRAKVMRLKGAKDPDEYIQKNGAAAFKEAVKAALPSTEFRISVIKSKYDITDTDQKVRFISEAADVLNTLSNAVEVDAYIKKLSDETGISKDAIYRTCQSKTEKDQKSNWLDIRQASNKNTHKENVREIVKREHTSPKLIEAEKRLLSLIASSKKLYLIAAKSLKYSDFSTAVYRRLAKALYDCYENGNTPEEAIILNEFSGNTEFENEASSVFYNMEIYDGDENTVRELLYNIELEHLQIRINSENDFTVLAELMKEKEQLLNERNKWEE